MKYAVIDRGDAVSTQLHQRFNQLAQSLNMELDEDKPEIVLSIGGDGTMLQAFHRYEHRLDDISFVGMHTGRLGFFADWIPEELEQLAQVMAATQKDNVMKCVTYPLVEIE
ncbi:NAD(+)/NADH kinase, partial [Gorillibacterium massiliense]|uniref:NAD(+)/NADH kinase n=1 Tax=Gorillibacterium massiliense TaxID=1280390 RepID=UPI0005932A8B